MNSDDMKKVYILTCTNEEGRAVSAKVCLSKEELQRRMREDYESEVEDAKSCGYEDYINGSIDSCGAWITYGEQSYTWDYFEDEIPV